MYIDPSVGGVLFQVLAVIFGVLSGLVLMFSGRIRMGFAKLRRKLRERSGKDNQSAVSPEAGPTIED